jgi:hypothetical protein
MILEEAAKSNVSEEEYRRRTVERKNNTKGLDFVCDVKMAESVPQTSSGRCIFYFSSIIPAVNSTMIINLAV